MKKSSDIVTIIICLALALSSANLGKIIPCAPADTTEQTDEPTVTDNRINPELRDEDFLGHTFNILNVNTGSDKTWSQCDIEAEKLNGELINDAVYVRNRFIEQKYNCIIKSRQFSYSEAASQLKSSIMAGDASFEFATLPLNQINPLALAGMLAEYSEIPHVDFSKPWWDSSSAKGLSIAGKLFAACSDLTIMDKNATAALVFNKQLIVDFGLANPYQLVNSGNWTIDKLEEMAHSVTKDLDGNRRLDENDLFGLIFQRDSINSFLIGCNGMIAVKDENDLPVITLIAPKNLEIFDKIFDLLYSDSSSLNATKYFYGKKDTPSAGTLRMYQGYQTLFMWVYMAEVESLRKMEPEFGILPIPKYDREQEEYLTSVNPGRCTAVIVPKTAQSYDRAGFIIEALSAESKYVLQPAYYNVLLRGKYYLDVESANMLDIIFSKKVYDLGDIYNFGNMSDKLKDMTMSSNRNIEETYKNSQKNADSALMKTIHIYQDFD